MPTESKLALKRRRCEHVNQAITIIATHGRRFFFSAATGQYASIEVDARGKVWWIDDYSQQRIYMHRTGFTNRWRGFTHGGTLRALAEAFRDHITTGVPLSQFYLGPERERISNGNIWGYSAEDILKVRNLAGALPVFRQPELQGT